MIRICENNRSIPFITLLIFFLNYTTEDDYLFSLARQHHTFSMSDSPKAYVVLAADFDTPTSMSNYGILAPLTSFIWQRIFNVTPVVMLGTNEPGRLTNFVEASFARLIRRAGGRVHCISRSKDSDGAGVALDPELIGATSVTALQVSRIASIALRYMNNDDVIFTTDADIWPMSNAFWQMHLTKILKPENDEFLVYNGPFYRSQKLLKDCNFLAVTIGFGTKTRIWRAILSIWLDSLQHAPSPRENFCVYRNTTDNDEPTLPWYSNNDQEFFSNILSGHKPISTSFPSLLRLFLEEGRKSYGASWDTEIQYTGEKYKQRRIWNYDQILVAEMLLASQYQLTVNEDLRRLDKFGHSETTLSEFHAAVRGRSVEDYTDAHLDSVSEKTWWRLELIWLLVFEAKNQDLFTEADFFFHEVRSFFEVVTTDIDDKIRGTFLFENDTKREETAELCDSLE